MRSRRTFWILSGLLLVAAGAWFFWPHEKGRAAAHPQPVASTIQNHPPTVVTVKSAATAPKLFANATTNAVAKTNQFAYRLNNTGKSIGELVNDPHAILLENAFIDTGVALNLSIPKNLQASGDPGAYIVQAKGPIDNEFRAMLAAAGAQVVSYIPNNAYLVEIGAGGAGGLSANALVQTVIPYEPYYKLSPSLLHQAAAEMPLPDGAALNFGLFAGTAAQTIEQIEKLGGQIVEQDNSPFGPVVRVIPPQNWTALATLPGVQIIEPYHKRIHANDLSRAITGVSVDSVTTSNYMNLSGSNVMVEVNDSGIDATHPDFSDNGTTPVRVFGDLANLVDTDGHGTHVAGIIAGDGTESTTVTNVPGSIMPGTNFQFRGKAPAAKLFSMDFNDSDQELQEAAARTNALISNNSWDYGGSSAYDLAAASYDAAVRDALPGVTGSQPVLFVFSAGNDGDGDDGSDPGGGIADSILSPATAKNVITVGAIQELRDITNQVQTVDNNGMTNTSTPWQEETSTPYRVAGFSSRGNVGIGTEGTYGRYKPDVVAPGTFIVSTRSAQWDIADYFYQDPTNFDVQVFSDLVIPVGSEFDNVFPIVPNNAVQVTIQIDPNGDSPDPFPNLPIAVALASENPPPYDFITTNNEVLIPGSPEVPANYLQNILDTESFYGFPYAISNTTTEPINFDLVTDIVTTNNGGNYFLVLSNLNQIIGTPNPASTGPGPYYRYESGTSMAAADVSGMLALMQDYFTNTLHTVPSPALLKAMLINGARATGFYNFHAQNSINYEGWGLINLPDSLPSGVKTNTGSGITGSMFVLDQSPTNALATGDTHTFNVAVSNPDAATLPLRITLAWTDPPGDPAAAIKLVNDLNLVVTNLDDPAHPIIYYGNDIPASSTFNAARDTNTPPVFDSINNIENVYLPPNTGTNFSVTVAGYRVNVNAVTAQTNNAIGAYAPNVVQDFALVISCGNGEVTNAITVTDTNIVSAPTTDQQITFITQTNTPLLNQFVGANTPLLGTNQIQLGSTELVTLGMTNQWHFYVVTNNATDSSGTNTSDVTNAAFITFLPDELSVPRMGVFADAADNPTRPEADIDVYVASGPNAYGLTNLDPTVISNCVNGTQIGASVGGVFNGASLSRGGTEFVVDTNSVHGQVYYVGVKSEDQVASEYGFLSVFTSVPFSTLDNGNEIVNGLLLPVAIPDGTPAHPGVGYVFALAIQPMDVQNVIVSNQITHENFGDLLGTLSHNDISDVLNNHDSLGDPPGPYSFIYDDTGQFAGARPSDGPGSLQNYVGTEAIGPWILREADDSFTQTGQVDALTLVIQPHIDLTHGHDFLVPPNSWIYGYVDVPVGYTNLTVAATNVSLDFLGTLPVSPPLQLFVEQGVLPVLTNSSVSLTNCPLGGPYPGGVGNDPGNLISTGPPLEPGRYFVGIYNPSSSAQEVFVLATLDFSASAIATVDFNSSGALPILDDAVVTSSIFVPNTDLIQSLSVGLRVDHPRISDLVFHLISPDGTRYLLMENRGGATTNGAGATIITTNIINVSAAGNNLPQTNYFNIGIISGTLPITYNFYGFPDEMTVYYGTNTTPANLILDTGFTNNPGDVPQTISVSFPPATATVTSTYITIVMNQFGNPEPQTQWTYTVGGVQTNFVYLSFTEDTNKTTTPIKFLPPPFVPNAIATNIFSDSFENYADNTYVTGGAFGGWIVLTNQAGITITPPAFDGTNLLALMNGAVVTNLPTVVGQRYVLSYQLGSSVSESGPVTNAGWQAESLVFLATSNSTPLVLNASGTVLQFSNAEVLTFGTNALLDDFSVTEVADDLYALPEQDISPLNNQSAFGTWQLEIQDDRAGEGLTNSLLGWQLEFVFANTNFVPSFPSISNGEPQTNVVPAHSISWFMITVPPNADIATNDLIFATAPVNLLFNQMVADTNGDFILLENSTGGSTNLSATTSPPLIPGATYFLGVQNTNDFAVTNAIEVDFHLFTASSPFAFTQPAQSITGAGAQLNGMATANGVSATAWFEWGTNTTYGNQTPPVGIGSSFSVFYMTNQISGLLTNVPYHFRLVVSNGFAVVDGFDQILDEANIVVWGANFAGQKLVPPGLSNVVAIAGAYDHSLALKNNGMVAVWGDDTFGQTNIPAALNTNLVAVAGGESYSLALKNDGTVIAWGANIFPNETNVPAGLNNVVTIASGQYSSLALKNNGTVVGWGANISGLTNVPAFLTNAVAIAGGSFHNLAIRNDGTVVAWGDDSVGQTNVPVGLTNVVGIAGGSFHSLALKNDGTVVAWGDDTAGQIDVPAGLTNVVAVAAGGFHSLALKNDGTVVGWGDDSAGQSSVPPGLSNVVAVAGGNLHSLALTPSFIVNSTNPIILPISAGVPQTNSILAGGIVYYQVNVPTNADFATNSLLFADGPLNILFTTNTPPPTNGAPVLIANSTNGVSVLSTTSTPTNIVPGGTYYLAVQNTNTITVTYGIEVDFHLQTSTTPSVTNAVFISSIVHTNIAGTNGFLLTWFAPTNDLFQVQWTPSLAPASWTTFPLPPAIGYDSFISPTNSQFQFFDDGTQTGGFDPVRFYRLLLLQSTNTLTLLFQTNLIANAGDTVTVTNTATDSNPAAVLTYNLVNPPTGASINNANGVITWTNAMPSGLAARFNTLVTDNGSPAASATNTFTVFVAPFPSITNITVTTTNLTLSWMAPTNDQFNVQWTTNLAPSSVWTTFPDLIISPTTGVFTFTDTNLLLVTKFYRLLLLP